MTIARTAKITVNVTAVEETTVTIAAMAEIASLRVTTRQTRSSRLPTPMQRTTEASKIVSSLSARGADADVVVASVITTGPPMKRERTPQTARQSRLRQSQNPVVIHIDDGRLTSATRDGGVDNARQ